MRRVIPADLALPAILIATGLAACTTASQYRRADGSTNVVVACGTALGWNICIDRAKQECPMGFDVLSQVDDGNRKEMTVACGSNPNQSVSAAMRAAAQCRLHVAESSSALPDAERQTRVQDCMLAAGYPPGSY